VSYFTLRIIIILMETIKDLYQKATPTTDFLRSPCAVTPGLVFQKGVLGVLRGVARAAFTQNGNYFVPLYFMAHTAGLAMLGQINTP
jgi:hypothetical protein